MGCEGGGRMLDGGAGGISVLNCPRKCIWWGPLDPASV